MRRNRLQSSMQLIPRPTSQTETPVLPVECSVAKVPMLTDDRIGSSQERKSQLGTRGLVQRLVDCNYRNCLAILFQMLETAESL